MCGIAGFVTTSPVDVLQRKVLLEKMLESQHHRGPDDRGEFFDSDASLGLNRLSIIDLSPRGRQPMGNEDGRIQVVFNGEIYNFETLREELTAAGHHFASSTDTEVLVHGYEQWGLPGLLDRIEGMFAFALWDANQRQLYLVRDHFGIKPLYYVERGKGLVFASELKALIAYDDAVPPIDRAGLLLSFQHIGVPAPETIYEGYRQLEPGKWLCFNVQKGGIHTHRYWSWSINAEIDDANQAAELLWETICGSVHKHLIADVPVGVFLSGGLDSSLVAAACAELGERPTCLTIAVADPRYDESPNAAAVCKHFGFPHWIEPMDADAGRPFDARLAEMFNEPFASSAALSAAYISQLAAKRFKVMLSGDGGDELFGGYRWYRTWVNSYGEHGQRLSVWRRPTNALRTLFGQRSIPVDPLEGYAQLVSSYTPARMAGLFNGSLLQRYPDAASARSLYAQIDDPTLEGFDRLQALDMQLFLPAVCLRKMDRTSMAHSLEVRVPLLDKVVASLAGRIDVDVRNPNATLKGLLKRLAREKLPEKIWRSRKRGFSTPVRSWFSSSSMLQDIENDMITGDWWCDIFSPDVMRTASKLKGRSLWRFWHTWRWVKQHAHRASQVGVA